MANKEELTTDMHAEFIGKEIPKLDLYVMGVYGALRRGLSLEDALARYGLSRKEYNDNIERVLSS